MKLTLLLEDDANDIILILRALRYVTLVVPITDRKDYIKALEENKFDLVLCDLKINNFLSLEPVRLARTKQPNIQLIVLTGSVSELDKESSILAGANYFIMKNSFKELQEKVKKILNI